MSVYKPFPGNNKFILVIVDDFSRYAKTYYLKHKSEAGDGLEKFIKHIRNLIGYDAKMCYVRADNAKELVGGRFLEVMSKEGSEQDFAPTYTPRLNGTSERFNETIRIKARAFMIDSGIPVTMWILAVEDACRIYNLTPHKSNDFVNPLMKLAPNKKDKLEAIKRLGCIAYAKISNPET